jgi:cysteine desulfurase
MDHLITYLDHGATTPLRPEVAAAMAEARAEPLGNPTGSHRPAQRARRLLEEARDEVAAFLGRDPGEIVFTSGGTESANLAVFGALGGGDEGAGDAGGGTGPALLCSAVEHPAVLESGRAAAAAGVEMAEVPVDAAGVVDVAALADAVTAGTRLVAVMLANNETGVVQPLAEVVDAVRARSGRALVFTDAVQAAPFLDVACATRGVDLVALSAHKVGGPVGAGVLAVGPTVTLTAHQHGGGQERERRSGTQDVVGAVGLAAALGLAGAERQAASSRVARLRDRLAEGLLSAVDGCYRTVSMGTGPEGTGPGGTGPGGSGVATLPGHLHLCLAGIEREELLVALGDRGVCASGGSSCASGALEPSHVLTAMGVPDDLARGAIRFTLGYGTTDADVDRALAIVPAAVASLRRQA